ncbi:hypothetical protein DFH01_10510 [Falsiroseomonas bella]|uniref:Uncharacterized protein n=1 Tax=Falsiroseomonas bella TaxID=2184016 RepID=A0A317FDW3_9PROT|nr:hypothetical protein [Falsiroseomonas bella]PWS37274.1 hypothetical protein DFH01_10510 [Falsiroseomonas bella]
MSGSDEDEDPIFSEAISAPAGLAVRILDLSGANGSDPVEVVRGFRSVAHANAFARRYVRDSLERCRTGGANPETVLEAWFAYGEDAEVVGAGDDAWRSAAELHAFAEHRSEDAEERNWRVLDPRREEDDEEEE